MKKTCQIAPFLLVFFLVLCACAKQDEPEQFIEINTSYGEAIDQHVNDLPGVSMEAVEGTTTETSVTIRMINDTEKTYTYGTEYDLQQLVDGTWYSMSYIIDNYSFTAVELFLEPGELEETINWGTFHGAMTSGTYRIVKDFYQNGDYTKPYWLAAEFTVQS